MTSVIDRRAFIGTLAGGLLAAPLAAEAQRPGRVYRIGSLASGIPEPLTASPQLAQPLRAPGWTEGQNLMFERRYDGGTRDRLPALAAELLINLKTAKVLGLTIPPSLLQRADQVIE